MKLVRLIKMCSNETYTEVNRGEQFSDMFTIHNGLNQRDTSLPLLFNSDFDYAIRKVQENVVGLKLNGTASGDVNILPR
jgi:hypothetical protein